MNNIIFGAKNVTFFVSLFGMKYMKLNYFLFLLIKKINPIYVVTLNTDLNLKSNVQLPIAINLSILSEITSDLQVALQANIKLSGKINFIEEIPEPLKKIADLINTNDMHTIFSEYKQFMLLEILKKK